MIDGDQELGCGQGDERDVRLEGEDFSEVRIEGEVGGFVVDFVFEVGDGEGVNFM